MFEKPKYIQNSFSVFFSRQSDIRQKDHDFEKKLKGFYFQPHIVPVPDDLDPEVPRMIFGSEHGYSQIIVSQVTLVLNVTYSPDWQIDISKGRQYLFERGPILFELLDILKGEKPYFCGLSTRVHLSTRTEDKEIIEHLEKLLLKNPMNSIYDFQVKTANVLSQRFFSNITLQNYRSWKLEGTRQGIIPLSQNNASDRGIEISGDFNDRYAFNENKDYYTSREKGEEIIESGLTEIKKMIMQVEESSS
ncbi:MAG TPA: hypothetical protein VLZ03_00190 [Thermodesulfobacteriota bacterium]|nr:hypothetical protein [Thermodesulfobacteriota bacterium]